MEKYQTFTARVVALIIDNLVFVPLTIINYLVSTLELPLDLFYLWLLMTSLAYPFYVVLMHGFYGQTLGKMVMKIKVVNTFENPIDFHRAVLRSLPQIIFNSGAVFFAMTQTVTNDRISIDSASEIVNIIVAVLTIIWSIADIFVFIVSEKHRAVHDFIAGTIVIKLNP